METKKTYTIPSIEIILLDNEISLALESSPPEGPGEGIGQSLQNNQNNPFKDTISIG